MIDAVTARWIRNASDERAAHSGCRFDERRGQHIIDWCEKYLRLYEGSEFAGKPLIPRDWQVEVLMRAFGWVRSSDFWNREVRRFRKVSVWVPKKNKKSPTGAAVGLYLLCADGEPGQKVFSAAKDGKQARIVHTHAMEMVRRSPVLSQQCKVHQGTGKIIHLPSSSVYEILSGDNILGQEGLNGSIIIDETHVVDARLASVLEHMGASRAEPMQFEISTAGDNPQGYGRKQYEYGKRVEDGTFPDDSFLFVAYEAPQDATDDQIENDPEIWKRANPAWGHTINEEEFRSSLQRAKRSLADWTKFKQYRLNIWAASANPWLKQDDWAKCAKPFTADDLVGKPCWLGLDLSKTGDMTAAVLVFREDEDHFYQLPFLWLPEEQAKAKNHLAPYLEWAEQGFLELTPGSVVDYRFVRRCIQQLHEQFRIKQIVFDRTYAEELTQTLEEEDGLDRLAFAQSWENYAGATADYERLVIAGTLHHNSHPILNWQAGHVQVKQQSNGHRRPMKPTPDDPKKIDAIVAGIMGLSQAIASETRSVYETTRALDFF